MIPMGATLDDSGVAVTRFHHPSSAQMGAALPPDVRRLMSARAGALPVIDEPRATVAGIVVELIEIDCSAALRTSGATGTLTSMTHVFVCTNCCGW